MSIGSISGTFGAGTVAPRLAVVSKDSMMLKASLPAEIGALVVKALDVALEEIPVS